MLRLFSGDDYADGHATELNTPERFGKRFGFDGKNLMPPPDGTLNWGVVRAVNEFAANVGVQYSVTFLNDVYASLPAWYIVKTC